MTPAMQPDTGAASPQAGRRALRVLVADDEPDTVLTLVELLREEGHDAQGVEDGTEVLPALREFDPDVVLLDISMPGMSGWDVARKIRQLCGQERPLLIAISGVYKEAADQILGKMAGFNYYLAKPYDPSVLITLLRDAQ
jgi:CheY-like chemotaxis protein